MEAHRNEVSIPSGTWRLRPQDHSCTPRLTTSSSLEHYLCCWCLGLTSDVRPQSVSHHPRSAARPHWRRHDEELVLRWVLRWAWTQVPAVTQGQVWPPTPLCRAGSCSPSPAQLSLSLPPCTPLSWPPVGNRRKDSVDLLVIFRQGRPHWQVPKPGHLKGHHWPTHCSFFLLLSPNNFPTSCRHRRQPH